MILKCRIHKLISIALVLSMSLSFTSCSKKKSSGRKASRSGQTIKADDPWFEDKRYDIDYGIDKTRPTEYVSRYLTGIDDRYFVIMNSGYYRMPDNITDWENFDYSGYEIGVLDVFDRLENKTVKTIDLRNDLSLEGYFDTINYSDGKIIVRTLNIDYNSGFSTIEENDIDPLTGEILETRKLDYDESNNSQRTYRFSGYRVDTIIDWGSENPFYTIKVTSPDGKSDSVELKEEGISIYDIQALFKLSDTTVLVFANTSNDELVYKLDLEKCVLTSADLKEYDWLNPNYLGYLILGSDGETYQKTSLGISRIDMKNKTFEDVFDFSWCGVSRRLLDSLEVVECSNDRIIMSGYRYSDGPNLTLSEQEAEFYVLEFTRAESNPHAGKTILELYSAGGYVDNVTGDAILQFNENNNGYFIEVTDRYNTNGSNSDDVLGSEAERNSEDDWDKFHLSQNSKLSASLAMDILNGDGPDILLNTSTHGQLNNPNYLSDLSLYIGNVDPEKYFGNVIDSARIDGNLYQIPISFAIDGIHTDYKYAGSSGVGFTTDEYETFLKNTLNGTDVISAGQAVYFAKIFSAESDVFIKNGKADFTGPEFEELARFVKDNVPENSISWINDTAGVIYETTTPVLVGATVFKGADIFKGNKNSPDEMQAIYATLYGYRNYFGSTTRLNGSRAILGLPSSDGRGPLVFPVISVAVSAQAENVDACGEFVKLLLSDDIQLRISLSDKLVVNREAFRQGAEAAVKFYNMEDDYAEYLSSDKNAQFSHTKYSNKDIDDLEKIVLSCSRISSEDSEISLILIEEMPAYFTGQKDLSAVIKIAQDRVQKVLDERG